MYKPVKYPCWTGTYRLDPPEDRQVIMRRRVLWKEPVAVYDFTNNPANPLTLWLSPTDWIQPPRHFDKMDFGSVPLCLQGFVSPISAPRTFALHDGLFELQFWIRNGKMEEVTLGQANSIIYPGMRAEGNNVYVASKAWTGVQIGGVWVWNRDPLTLANARREASAKAMIARAIDTVTETKV